MYRSGHTLYVSKGHPHVIRVCVAGDVHRRCFGGASVGSMHTPGCEVVDSDCTCYRWQFNSRGAQYAPALTVTPHPTQTGCATLVFRPDVEPAASAKIDFVLDHFRPVVPRGWLYAAYARYQHVKKGSKYAKPFFTYLYEAADEICGAEKVKPAAMAYNCRRDITVQVVAIDTPVFTSQWGFFISAVGIVTLVAVAVLRGSP